MLQLCDSLDFPLDFSFCALVFKLLFFSLSPSLSPTSNYCSELLLLQLFSAILSEPVRSVVELSAFPFEVCLFSSPLFFMA